MLHRANSPSAASSPPSPHRDNRRGRGACRGGGGGDGSSTTKGYFLFVALVATMLPVRVAGQSMECWSHSQQLLQSSTATLTWLNNITPDGVTFTHSGINDTVGLFVINPLPSFLTHLQTNVPPTDGVHSTL